MPERLNVVRLTAEEKQVLTEAVRAQHADAVSREVRASLKEGAETVTTSAKTADVDARTLKTARTTLVRRQRLLESLPKGEGQRSALEATKSAIAVANEALAMFDGGSEG